MTEHTLDPLFDKVVTKWPKKETILSAGAFQVKIYFEKRRPPLVKGFVELDAIYNIMHPEFQPFIANLAAQSDAFKAKFRNFGSPNNGRIGGAFVTVRLGPDAESLVPHNGDVNEADFKAILKETLQRLQTENGFFEGLKVDFNWCSSFAATNAWTTFFWAGVRAGQSPADLRDYFVKHFPERTEFQKVEALTQDDLDLLERLVVCKG